MKKNAKNKKRQSFRIGRKTAAAIMAAILAVTGISAREKKGRTAYERLYRIKVVAVVDGDTVDIDFLKDVPPDCTKEKQRVRLIGVDTPEYYKEEKQPYAEEAKDYTDRYWKKEMVLRLDPDTSYKDKYGRILAYLYTKEGLMLNYELIRAGYGRYYDKFKFSSANMDSFKRAEEYARKNRLGLWGITKTKKTSFLPLRDKNAWNKNIKLYALPGKSQETEYDRNNNSGWDR